MHLPNCCAWFMQLLNDVYTESKDTASKTKVSVFPALLKTFGYEFFLGSLIQSVYTGMSIVSPQIQKQLINYVGQKYNAEDETGFAYKGVLFAGLLLANTVFLSICNGQYFNKMFAIAMKIRTSVNSCIYRKALKLSNTARKESTVEEIVNLMSVDVQRFTVRKTQ